MEVILFIGAPGSGKSTFYRERFQSSHVLISKDLLRNNRNPSRRQRQLLEEALAAGRNVVVDNTHPTRESRAQVLDVARANNVPVDGYVFESVASECVARNSGRTGKARVPEVAIFSWFDRCEPPLPNEGFRGLFQVRTDGAGGFLVAP